MKTTTPALLFACALLACAADRDENGILGDGIDPGDGFGDDGGDDGTDAGDEGDDDGSPDTGGDDGGGDGGDPDTGGDDGGGDDGDDDGGDPDTGGDGGDGADCGPSGGGGGPTGLSPMRVGSGPEAWLYVPSSYSDSEATPMVVTLHGSGDSPQNFVHWFPDANVADTVITLTPGGEDPSGWAETDIPLILDVIDEMTLHYNVDTCRIYLMGFSAGAYMSYIIGLEHADELAGFGSVAGSIEYAEAWGVWPNNVPRKIAVDIHHGTLDGIEAARYSRDQLEAAGHKVYYTELQGVGHTVSAQMAAEMWANLKSHRVDE